MPEQTVNYMESVQAKTQAIFQDASHCSSLLYNEPALVTYNVLSSLLITIDAGRSGNPVRGNCNLVIDWREYEHSIAGFYELKQVKHFIPLHYEELE